MQWQTVDLILYSHGNFVVVVASSARIRNKKDFLIKNFTRMAWRKKELANDNYSRGIWNEIA